MKRLCIILLALMLILTAGCINPLAPKTPSPTPSTGPSGPPEISANLSKGYQKLFAVSANGMNYTKTITHPATFIYRTEDDTGNSTLYVDQNNSIIKVERDNLTIRYLNPWPVVEFPLTEGKNWSYASTIILEANNRSFEEHLAINTTVTGFGYVTISYAPTNQTTNAAYQGNHTYLAARVVEESVTTYSAGGTNFTISNESIKWYAQDLGLIKSYTISERFIGNSLDQVSEREEVLIEFKS